MIKTRKRRISKKSEKYVNLAQIRWDKSKPEAIAQNTQKPTVSTSSQRSNIDNVQGPIQSETTVTSQDINIENTGDDQGIEAEAENVVSTANYGNAAGIPDLFDDETQGTIEKVVNELNKTNEHIQSSSISVVNSLLDENNSDSRDSDTSYTDSEYQAGESSSEYCLTPLKKARHNPISLGNSLFICQTSQVQSFIDQINETALCHTPHCTTN